MSWTEVETSVTDNVNSSITVYDSNFRVKDNVDATKVLQFQVSGLTTATTRTLTVPDADTTIVGTDATQTLTNKTLTTPTIGSFTNATHTHANAAGGGQITTAALSDYTEWTAVTFDAALFTGAASMTWTVASGDVTTFAYKIVGKTMHIAWHILTTTVGGTPSATLQITLPASKVATRTMTTPYSYIDNGGTEAAGLCFVSASGTVIGLTKYGSGAWNAASDATAVKGQITIQIN